MRLPGSAPREPGRERRTADGRPIVLVVAQAAPATGGIATYAEALCDDPVLAERFALELVNTTRRAVRRGGTWSLENVRNGVRDAVRTFRRGRHAALVHYQTALVPLLPMVRTLAICGAAKLAGARVVVHVHAGRVTPTGDAFASTSAFRTILRMLSRVVDVVATVSEEVRSHLSSSSRAPVVRVDNAVDVAAFGRASGDDEPPHVVFVGTLARRKGVLDLLDAALTLRRDGVGLRLTVVGEGAEAGDAEADVVRERFRAAGLSDALVGALRHDDVRSLLGSADVFVLPSHTEGQPLSVLEAMASSLPVVVSRVGAIPDVVRDGVEGHLVEPGDTAALTEALRGLLDDEERRRRFGAAARARAVERFDLPVWREAVTALYTGALR